CGGFSHAIGLLGAVLQRSGARTIGVEDPGHAVIREVAARTGLTPVPVRVEEHGLDVAALRKADPDVVMVTPAHQFPTGVVMLPQRRAELIGWAVEKGALVIEDDYDAEYRYDRAPVGSLQGRAPEQVVYVGSSSKTLAPTLRL